MLRTPVQQFGSSEVAGVDILGKCHCYFERACVKPALSEVEWEKSLLIELRIDFGHRQKPRGRVGVNLPGRFGSEW